MVTAKLGSANQYEYPYSGEHSNIAHIHVYPAPPDSNAVAHIYSDCYCGYPDIDPNLVAYRVGNANHVSLSAQEPKR